MVNIDKPINEKEALSAADIGQILGCSRQAVDKMAKKGGWPTIWEGRAKLFPVAGLPKDVSVRIAAKSCPYTPPAITPAKEAGLADIMKLKGKKKIRFATRTAIIALYKSFAARANLADTPCREAFAVRWAAGEIEAEPWLREELPSFCANSLQNWLETEEEEGSAALGGKFGKHRKGTGVIESTPMMRESILGMMAEHPNASAALIREWLEAKFQKVPSLRRLQAWVSEWKKAHPGEWMYVQAPDRWRSRFMAACGDAYELIDRQNQLWEYDGTPSDVMLSDGKRYAIIGVINIFDRRLKLEVVPTSTARDVAALTRRCLIDWGVPEEVKTDNGKDFVASYLQQVFHSLGVLQTILPPFRPDLKPGIERAFRTFSHHLLTICPCYVGHNVATRQEIRERESFAKRLMDRKNPQELSMAFSPQELQAFCDDWCENTYAHRPHSGLNGRTPWEVAQDWIMPVRRIENERALDVLLVPLASGDGFRDVGKKGLRCASGVYVAPELGGIVGHRVQVRMDPADLTWAYVFDDDGNFLCRAERTDGLSAEQMREEAKAMQRVSKAAPKAVSKEMRDMAKLTEADQAMPVIREHHRKRAEAIRAKGVDQRSTVYTTPELEAAADAVNAHIPAVAVTEQSREIVPGFTPPATAQERYKLLLALQAREDLTEAEAKWVRIYSACLEADGFRRMYQICAANG